MYRENLDIVQVAPLFRQIKVSNNLCNIVQQSCLNLLICVASTIESLSLFLLSKVCGPAEANLTFVILVALVICVVNCMIIIITLTSGMVRLHKESGYLQVKIKRLHENRRTTCNMKLLRKYWQSCRKVKINLGISIFLEECTPLKCLN